MPEENKRPSPGLNLADMLNEDPPPAAPRQVEPTREQMVAVGASVGFVSRQPVAEIRAPAEAPSPALQSSAPAPKPAKSRKPAAVEPPPAPAGKHNKSVTGRTIPITTTISQASQDLIKDLMYEHRLSYFVEVLEMGLEAIVKVHGTPPRSPRR
ncbi:MAG TPA: hypothetical protein VGU69_10675 [Rhizomicrobium sp.]|nr:hypothetical protein [Rhizomicrobium sp.]